MNGYSAVGRDGRVAGCDAAIAEVSGFPPDASEQTSSNCDPADANSGILLPLSESTNNHWRARPATKEGSMKGVRHSLRDFTATTVKEHLRSQIVDADGPPELTKNEIELVRLIYEGSFDWQGFLAERSSDP
jgi:hypothetical protein